MTLPKDGSRTHRITTTVGGKQIDGWIEYDVINSMVEPCDGFSMSRPFDLDAWKLCRTDQSVQVAVDGVIKLDGFIDARTRVSDDGTMEISGRDKAGRLVQESIPTTGGYDGLQLTEAIKRLAAPWFNAITLSDARNRAVSRGKGHRAPAAGEPAIFNVKGKLDEDHAGRVDPGETRWAVIEQLVSSVGLLCWSSADGRELVIGKPNYKQGIQYLFRHSKRDGSTVKKMRYEESVQDRYALIEVHGSGAGDDADFGDNVTSYLGTAKDGPNLDGTGRDFLHPKRLALSQHAVQSNAEAAREAVREMSRRNFKRRHITITCDRHGQVLTGNVPTLFAPNTLAICADDELGMEEVWLLYACRLHGVRGGGETTELMLVPSGTEFVQ